MSVHQRSPLCADFLDYYKPVTTRFRREIDQKIVSKDNTPNEGVTSPKNDPNSKWDGLRMMVENANAELVDQNSEAMEAGNKGKLSKRSLESDDFEEDYSPMALERRLTKIN